MRSDVRSWFRWSAAALLALAPSAHGGEEPGTRAPAASTLPGSCAVVALREGTSMGQVLHALAFGPSAGAPDEESVRAVFAAPVEGIPHVGLQEAGRPGRLAGVNARHLSVSYEATAGADPLAAGSPAVAVERVLERASSIEEAEGVLRSFPPVNARFLVADGRRLDARVFEVHGEHMNVRRPDDGLVFGEDPRAALECFVGACDPAVPRSSGPDDEALRRLLSETPGHVRMPVLHKALGDAAVAHDRTAVACVLEPQLLRVQYALRPHARAAAGGLTWQQVDLLAHLGKERAARFAPPWHVAETGEVVVDPKPTRLGKVTLTRVSFDSPAPSGIATNDRINAILYKPETVRGTVIALPAWKESTLAGQSVLALRLAADGYAVLVMPLPWQVDRAVPGVGSGAWTLSDDLARTRAAFFQGTADVARASLWLEQAQGVPPARQAVMGVSLGGHVAALAYGAYPQRFGAGVFLLAGGNLETALMNPNRTTGRMRKALLDRGVTPEEARDLIEAIDGVTWAEPGRGRGVLIVGADADDVVPPANVRALAAAYGKDVRLEWVPGDHYGILLHLPRALGWVVEHLGKVLPPP